MNTVLIEQCQLGDGGGKYELLAFLMHTRFDGLSIRALWHDTREEGGREQRVLTCSIHDIPLYRGVFNREILIHSKLSWDQTQLAIFISKALESIWLSVQLYALSQV